LFYKTPEIVATPLEGFSFAGGLTHEATPDSVTDGLVCLLCRDNQMRAVTQPRALETREKILQAAARLFALKGYHDAKLEGVLDAAQVTKGAFFHHFRDREDLGFAVLDWHMDRRRQTLDAIEQELPLAEGADPLQRVFRRLDAIQEMARRRERSKGGCVIGNLSTALSDCHDGFRKRLAPIPFNVA
jgi:TetR/AcrR family transcriptional repressor of nem operon